MGRRGSRKAETYYCPQCHRKRLSPEHKYDYSKGINKKVWVCHNSPPKKTAKLAEMEEGQEAYDYFYEIKSEKAGEEAIAKAKAYVKKHPTCGLIIEKPDGE